MAVISAKITHQDADVKTENIRSMCSGHRGVIVSCPHNPDLIGAYVIKPITDDWCVTLGCGYILDEKDIRIRVLTKGESLTITEKG